MLQPVLNVMIWGSDLCQAPAMVSAGEKKIKE